jgi:hypothetical protein
VQNRLGKEKEHKPTTEGAANNHGHSLPKGRSGCCHPVLSAEDRRTSAQRSTHCAQVQPSLLAANEWVLTTKARTLTRWPNESSYFPGFHIFLLAFITRKKLHAFLIQYRTFPNVSALALYIAK